MLKKGDVTVYGNHGLCQVDDIQVPDFLAGKQEKLYYVMSPATDRKAVLYVPVEGADDKMRNAISHDDADELLTELQDMTAMEIPAGKRAESVITDVIKVNEASDMMRLVKGLHKMRATRAREGKKLASMNERHLVTAEKLLYSELAFSLEREVTEIKEQVMEVLESLPL